MTPTLPPSLIQRLDKHPIASVEEYISMRKICKVEQALEDQIMSLSPEEVHTFITRFNRSFLDGKYDDLTDDIIDEDIEP